MVVKAEKGFSAGWSCFGVGGTLLWALSELLGEKGPLVCSEGRYATNLDKTPPGNRPILAHCKLAEMFMGITILLLKQLENAD